jgi:hypothetical protein
MSTLKIHFTESRGIVAALVVDVPEGLLTAEDLHAALFDLRVQVVSVDEQLQGGRVAHRFAVCDFDGGPLRNRRRRDIVSVMHSELSWALSMRAMVPSLPGVVSASPVHSRARRAA